MQRCECWSDDRRSNRCRSARSSQGEALIRTILDTSVLISSLVKGSWRQFADATENGRLGLITSPAAIDEFMDVVKRPFTISFRQATPINSAIFYGEPNCSARRIPQVRLERLSANSSIGRDRNADPWKMAGLSNISVMKASGFL